MPDPISWSFSWPYMFGAFIFGYFIGSIATGRIVTLLAKTQDLSKIGSGNVGATNVLRTGRKDLAFITLIGDLFKGFIATYLAYSYYGSDIAVMAAIGVFIGHLYPIWFGFKGGKGVATYIGILLAFSWVCAVIFCLVWLFIAFTTRYSSLSALIGSFFAAISAFLFADKQLAEVISALTLLIWITHWANINRLIKGQESKIGQKNNV